MILVGPSPCFLNDPPDYASRFEREILDGLLANREKNYIDWASYLASVIASASGESALSGELSDSFHSTDPVVARLFAQATFFSDTFPCSVASHQYGKKEEQTKHLALHDALTGLLNRHMLLDRLNQSIARAQGKK